MKKPVSKSFMIMLLMMICLSNLTPSRSQSNLIPVDRDKLKTVLAQAELSETYEKEVTVLILENSRLKEIIKNEKEAGQKLKNELEEIESAYNTTRLILLFFGLFIVAYVVIKIRSR